MSRVIVASIQSFFLLLIDYLAFDLLKEASSEWSPAIQIFSYSIFWGISVAIIAMVFTFHLRRMERGRRTWMLTAIFSQFMSKLFMILFGLFDVVRRGGIWTFNYIVNQNPPEIEPSATVAQAGLFFALIPIGAIVYGIIKGAHDYQIKREKVVLPNLPKAFDKLKIIQISDIHAGSFWDKAAVAKGIDMILAEKPDLILFTGDLVNNKAGEMEEYTPIFSRLHAPLGVFSILGNHDYGDYVYWPSKEAKRANLERLIQIHKEMGWQILLNEYTMLEKDGEQIAVIGIENWSNKAHFPKYGRMSEAYAGTEHVAVKLLLSHDPSHWRSEVTKDYPDIDITFSGHTHGMQFGIDTQIFQWSPVKYVYPEWAGLYREKDQYLYVNRGFGYLGFPGRIGMRPEITVVELAMA